MKNVTVEDYLQHNGLQKILKFQTKQDLVRAYPPSWIDVLKKGKSRVCYSGSQGTLELLFENQELSFEHYDFERNTLSEEGSIVLCSEQFYFAAELEAVRNNLRTMRLVEKDFNQLTEDHCYLSLDNGCRLDFSEQGLVSMGTKYR